MSCDVGHRLGLDLALLWLWCRTAAVAPIRPLVREPPYAMGAGIKDKERKKKGKEMWPSLSFPSWRQGLGKIKQCPLKD